LEEKLTYVESLIDRTIESIHRIAGDLRPGILDFGIVAAIEWQAREFEKQVGIPCHVNSNKKEIELHPDQATALFRIFQEALTNISKHAGATSVDVKLSRTNRNIRLEIADNGKGIADADKGKPQSFGIRGMIERAGALGGDLALEERPGGGCVVSIRIPLSSA
jgi:signal transduction histidine kinase